MKFIIISILIILAACSAPQKIKVRLLQYDPISSDRDALQLTEYRLEHHNLQFAKSLYLDTVFLFKRSFNDYQSLYNNLGKKEIDTATYNARLVNLQRQDSIAKISQKTFRNSLIIPDTTIDADIKVLIGIAKSKEEITVIVDENNNGDFSDDRIIKMTPETYKSVLNKQHFTISNLKVPAEGGQIKKTTMSIMLDQIGNSTKSINMSDLLKYSTPWISAGKYFKGEKKVSKKIFYFNFIEFIYNIGYPSYREIVGDVPISDTGHLSKYDTLFKGNIFRIHGTLYKLDSISETAKKAFIRKVTNKSKYRNSDINTHETAL